VREQIVLDVTNNTDKLFLSRRTGFLLDLSPLWCKRSHGIWERKRSGDRRVWPTSKHFADICRNGRLQRQLWCRRTGWVKTTAPQLHRPCMQTFESIAR